MKRKEKVKAKYSAVSNVAYLFRLIQKNQRYLFLALIGSIPAAFLGNLIAAYLPTIIINTIAVSNIAGKIILVILGIFSVSAP